MRLTSRPSRLRRSVRLGSLGSAALLCLVVGCASAASKPAESPAPAGAQRVNVATSAELGQSPNEPIEKYLAARSAGVVVGRTAEGNLTLRVRGGSSSQYGNNSPLY